jgi:DMSO/TMAO reductase YedYZ molybdopterin-dependent catalytic subunit
VGVAALSANLDPRNPDPYYVSIDLGTAHHPQALLATHKDGRPLPLAHGAPPRLLVPMKLGLKNIKAITDTPTRRTNPRTTGTSRGTEVRRTCSQASQLAHDRERQQHHGRHRGSPARRGQRLVRRHGVSSGATWFIGPIPEQEVEHLEHAPFPVHTPHASASEGMKHAPTSQPAAAAPRPRARAAPLAPRRARARAAPAIHAAASWCASGRGENTSARRWRPRARRAAKHSSSGRIHADGGSHARAMPSGVSQHASASPAAMSHHGHGMPGP